MSTRWDAVPAVGIDFGTTNSSVALATRDAQVELVRFATREGETFSSRSVLYLEKVKDASGVRRTHSWTGPSAIEHYLDAEDKGRLIQSLKSYLPSRTLTGGRTSLRISSGGFFPIFVSMRNGSLGNRFDTRWWDVPCGSSARRRKTMMRTRCSG
jgi:hypothetical protein